MSTLAILSDIHGNMLALNSVLEDMQLFHIDGIVALGDLIDYGMQSNEVADFFIKGNPYDMIANIWGNHERAILEEDYSGFSSARGVESAQYTRRNLNQESLDYLNTEMQKAGYTEFRIDGKTCLAIHGSLDDPYWKSITPANLRGYYKKYDFVFSGHSHIPHWFTYFYEDDNEEYRNKKAVVFLNPGSIGQPRNHCPFAQYALVNMTDGETFIRRVFYDVEQAMALYNDGFVDSFYRNRLKKGI